MKTLKFYFAVAMVLLAAGCGSDTIDGNGDFFRKNTFTGCSKLTEIHAKPVTPPVMGSKFPNASKSTLYVPKGCLDAYKADEMWGQFEIIKEE